MDTIGIIKEILQDSLDIDPANVTEESTFDSLNIDSLDMVQLVMELEERLGIELGDFEDSADMQSLGQFVKYVDDLKASN